MIIFFNFESDPDVNFYSDISPLDTKYLNPNEIREGFECLCKNGFSALHVNIRSVNKNFETFKNFYSKLNCTFRVIFFFFFQKPGLLIILFGMIRIFR